MKAVKPTELGKIDEGDTPIDERGVPPQPYRNTLSEPTLRIEIEPPRDFAGFRRAVTTRVGRFQNGDRTAGATGTKTAFVADLQTMLDDMRT